MLDGYVWCDLVSWVRVLLARIDHSAQIDTSQYPFQVMAGLGVGVVNAALTLLVPYVIDKKDPGQSGTILKELN